MFTVGSAFHAPCTLPIRQAAHHPAYRFACCSTKSTSLTSLGRFRPARPNDTFKLAWMAIREGMNPLLGSMDNFIVFESTEGKVVAGGQVRAGEPGEISTVVVEAALRQRGIGSALVGELVSANKTRDLCLITLARHAPFYEQHGFRICEEDVLPAVMRVEMQLGKVVVGIVEPGMSLIAMVRYKEM